ncbi:MAG: class I SAM-dependent methyltransferase [Trueperaceae bacterium]|nr:class I SAM-dependent methyltransferase [Trueperaceae bacterium]
MTLPTVRLPDHLADALAAGHPWVYREAVHGRPTIADGTWVRVEAGRAAAVGLWATEGAIAVRNLRRAAAGGPLAVPDRAWVEATVARALDQRARLGLGHGSPAATDAYRLLFGEGDGLPGLTVDRYGRFAVVKTYAEGYRRPGTDAHALLAAVVRALAGALRLKGVLAAPRADEPLAALHGELPPPEVTVREHGLAFLANLHEGQKTGLFLDHRENRATVRGLARGRRVANLFAYAGAFSLHALAGGAARAVDVDVAVAALADAERNVAANAAAIEAADPDGGPARERHATLALDLLADPAAALRHPQLAGSDLVVLDPPSLARHKGQRHAALRAYRRLNAAAMAALPDGGLLASASCTAQVSPEAFRGVLAEAAAEAGVDARVLHEAGHAGDHPVPLAFPEGRYLKFVVLRIDRPS